MLRLPTENTLDREVDKMAEWKECTISDIGIVVGGATPSTKKPENYEGGTIAWITPKDLSSFTGRYIRRGERNITEIGLNSCSTQLLPANTVLFSSRAPIGYIAIAENEVCTNQGFKSVIPNDDTDSLFLYYLLKFNKKVIENMGSGTTFKEVSGNVMKDIRVKIPVSIEEQRKIAGILGSLDDKIEKNEEINNNLEQEAQAIFKSYFIDFEPYGNVVPSTWKKTSLDDVCYKITDGSHYSPIDVPNAPYPMYSVKDMETYGFNPSSCKHITEDEFKKMQQSDCVPMVDDILVAKDGSYLKEIFICSEAKEEAILSSIAIFRPNPNIILPEFLLYLLKQPSIRRDVGDNYVSGSALPRIVLKDFKKYKFILPPLIEQEKINGILHSIRMQTKANIGENRSLSTLRDTLLPQLMSGEIDVSNIDF